MHSKFILVYTDDNFSFASLFISIFVNLLYKFVKNLFDTQTSTNIFITMNHRSSTTTISLITAIKVFHAIFEKDMSLSKVCLLKYSDTVLMRMYTFCMITAKITFFLYFVILSTYGGIVVVLLF